MDDHLDTDYDTDLLLWTNRQVELLRTCACCKNIY
jgi:hypothetical protein